MEKIISLNAMRGDGLSEKDLEKMLKELGEVISKDFGIYDLYGEEVKY